MRLFKLHFGNWFHFELTPDGCLVTGAVVALLIIAGGIGTCATINRQFSPACGAGGQCYVQNNSNTSTQTLPTAHP